MIIRIVTTFILALLLISCAPARVSDSASSTPISARETFTPEILENGWYRFTETESGYSIDYPPDSYLTISHDVALEYPHLLITLKLPSGFQDMQVIVYSNQERSSIKEIVTQKVYQGNLPKDKSEKLSLQQIKIAGHDAMKLEMTPFLPGIFISAKSKIYFISLPTEMLSGNPPNTESIDLFYKIVNTFSLEK